MPLTRFQRELLAVIGQTRTPDSYLAGGTALHFSPESTRYSRDLDLFHDAEKRVAQAFNVDRHLLEAAGFTLEIAISQPGFIRAVVARNEAVTQIDWAHDSAWRFMPVVRDPLGGYLLHEIDLATNKVLVLAGRNEPRDFVDVLFILDRILPLGALVWAAAAKDPGFSPLSLVEHLRRRGRVRQEEVDRLDLVKRIDITVAKTRWLVALDNAETFVSGRPPEELGCLYYHGASGRFVQPDSDQSLQSQNLMIHFGRPGGVLPTPSDQPIE